MQGEVEALTAEVPGVAWSVSVRSRAEVLAALNPERVLPTASVGKVLLLLEVARRFEDGTLDPAQVLSPEPADLVGDSGLWQHLPEPGLSAASLAVLVGSVSDNLATNVLLRVVGLPAVAAAADSCGVPRVRLLDRIRDVRTPDDPPWPSEGCAADLAALMDLIDRGLALSADASRQVAGWLALDVDTSMVAGSLGVDPLAHTSGAIRLFHKTGTDEGVRADVGQVSGPSGSCSYAVLAHWDEGDRAIEVLEVMRRIGLRVRAVVA